MLGVYSSGNSLTARAHVAFNRSYCYSWSCQLRYLYPFTNNNTLVMFYTNNVARTAHMAALPNSHCLIIETSNNCFFSLTRRVRLNSHHRHARMALIPSRRIDLQVAMWLSRDKRRAAPPTQCTLIIRPWSIQPPFKPVMTEYTGCAFRVDRDDDPFVF